jgi:hypothetical protein
MAAAAVAGGGGGTGSPPGGSPIPGSPIPLSTGDYATSAAMANAAYNQALSAINGQRQSALQSFGYAGTIDPATGQLTDMHVDPNNPYGQFQQMLGQGAADQQAVQAADMSRGIGPAFGPRGGGLAAQGLTNAKLAFGANSANLGQSLMGTLGDLSNQQQGAQDTMNNALWQAELASAQNAIQGQDFNPADFSGVTNQPAAGGADPGAKTFTVAPSPSTPSNRGRGVRSGNTFHRAVQGRHSGGTRGRRRR